MNKVLEKEENIKFLQDGTLAIVEELTNNRTSLLIKDNIENIKRLGNNIEYAGSYLQNSKALIFIFLLKFTDANIIYEYVLNLKDEEEKRMFANLIALDDINYVVYSDKQEVVAQFKNILKDKLKIGLDNATKIADSLDYSVDDVQELKSYVATTLSKEDLWREIVKV